MGNTSAVKVLLKNGAKVQARNDQKVPEKPTSKCTGFTYYGAKLYNKIPCDIRKTPNSVQFKALVKEWIWKNIPSF